jgi:predicted MFS family arabinose efflux permease
MTVPAVLSLMLLAITWRPALFILGGVGIVIGAAILFAAPRPESAPAVSRPDSQQAEFARERQPFAFALLTSIGVIDSATRMGFLLFLPFVLTAKGATLQSVGLAMTLIFAGGAAGKLACAFLGARIGAIGTVWLTEGLTAAGILALSQLPLLPALILLPLIGVALNGTSSVLYGSVPELVEPHWRTRALSIFYTGTIGSGAIAPVLFGRLGDLLGVWSALTVVALFVLLTLPIAWLLRHSSPR